MDNEQWRARLAEAFAKSNKSKRSISLASGNGPGYLHSILSEGKDPTINNLISICEAMDVDPIFVLHGIEATPEQVRVLRLIQEHPAQAKAILSLLGESEEV